MAMCSTNKAGSVVYLRFCPRTTWHLLFATILMPAPPLGEEQEAKMEAPHHSHRSAGGGGSELFICFTSRPSSSSSAAAACAAAVRVSSTKSSLMSPGRARDSSTPLSLSASLSRRLRSSGSIKGGQSPAIFPAGVTAARKKGCAFEAVEPSSPKVTCIGQVRVKSKKKGAAAATATAKGVVVRSRSQRSGSGEASFRRLGEKDKCTSVHIGKERKLICGEIECLPQRNQRWVQQLPFAICEALKSLGSEFNCFVPCKGGGGKSFCSSSRGVDEKGDAMESNLEKRSTSATTSSSSCAAIFARWLMAVHGSDVDSRPQEVVGLVLEERLQKRCDMDLMANAVEENEVVAEEPVIINMVRRMEEVAMKVEEEEEEQVKICDPPRNALLLMRCRSDPVRMAALANRLWGSPVAAPQGENDDHEQEDLNAREPSGDQLSAAIISSVADAEVTEKSREAENRDIALEGRGYQAGVEEVKMLNELEEDEKDRQLQERKAREGGLDQLPAEESVEELEAQLSQENFQKEEELEAQSSQGNFQKDEETKEDNGVRAEEEEGMQGKRSRSLTERRTTKAREREMRRSRSAKDKERRRNSFSSEREASSRRSSISSEKEARRASFSGDGDGRRRWSFSMERQSAKQVAKVLLKANSKEAETMDIEAGDEQENLQESVKNMKIAVELSQVSQPGAAIESNREDPKVTELPECLLLMMYEPKLSMEVSKETWVCSTDFLHWRPPRYVNQRARAKPACGGGEVGESRKVIKKRDAHTVVHQQQQPKPPPPPSPPLTLPSEFEKKLLEHAAPAKPFVLTRCKSEPLRSSARLAPETWFWKDRHQPINAAGMGF